MSDTKSSTPTAPTLSQPTPGPWLVRIGETYVRRLAQKQNGPCNTGVYGCVEGGGPDELIICDVWADDVWADDDDARGVHAHAPANARLIAAAPDLYRACRDYIDWWERVPDRECVAAVIEKMRAALALAEGRDAA